MVDRQKSGCCLDVFACFWIIIAAVGADTVCAALPDVVAATTAAGEGRVGDLVCMEDFTAES